MNLPADVEVLPTPEKLKVILNEPSNVKLMAIYIANSLDMRSRLQNSI